MQSVLRDANDIFADNGMPQPPVKNGEMKIPEGWSKGNLKKPQDESDTQIIAKNEGKSSLSMLTKFSLTKEKREKLRNMKYVIDGLFVEGYHSYVYGQAGAGKTTILLNLGFEMVAKGYKVFFFYLDGELFSASKVSEEIDARGATDSYHILTDGTMGEYQAIMQELIDKKEDLSNTVFILDSFKYFSEDLNNKNANKKAMHFIKDVCKLGVTFISLGHTNKDGKKESGTAEIEQDSDAVLRIDSSASLDGSTNISTIKKGGRCRCEIKEASFEFVGGDPLQVYKQDEVIDVEAALKKQEERYKDLDLINEVKLLLYNGGEKTQSELLELLKDCGVGKNSIIKRLKRYIGTEWNEKKGEKNASIYFLNDDLMQQWRQLGESDPIIEEQKEATLLD